MAGDGGDWAEFDEWIRRMSDVLIKLTGLWERTRRGNTEGQFYLVGRLGAAKILAFKNNRKELDADPDWNLFLTEPSPPQDARRHTRPSVVMRPRKRCASMPTPWRPASWAAR